MRIPSLFSPVRVAASSSAPHMVGAVICVQITGNALYSRKDSTLVTQGTRDTSMLRSTSSYTREVGATTCAEDIPPSFWWSRGRLLRGQSLKTYSTCSQRQILRAFCLTRILLPLIVLSPLCMYGSEPTPRPGSPSSTATTILNSTIVFSPT